MAYFPGLDVSVKETSVCIVDDARHSAGTGSGGRAPTSQRSAGSVGEVIARSAVLARNDTEAVMLDLVQSLATRGSLSVLSEGTARRTRRAGAPAVSGRVWPPLSPRRWPRARITTSTSTTVRAHVSSSGRRPPHAVRSAGVAYLPICGFQEFHPVGRRKQLRLGCLVRAATSWFR
jgi:hypothetical protein